MQMCDQVKYCNKCKRTLPLDLYFWKKKRKNGKIGYQANCKDCHKRYPRSQKRKETIKNYNKKKYHEDIQYKTALAIRRDIRRMLNRLLNGKFQLAKDKHRDNLGCSISYYKTYLESKFQEGMTWENYGVCGWHIDHIIPCTAFDLTDPEQIKKCFHYTNTQPLWAKDNAKKKNTIPV